MGVRGTLRDLDLVFLSSAPVLTCLFGLDRDLEREEAFDTEDILEEIDLESNPWVDDRGPDGVGRRGIGRSSVAVVLHAGLVEVERVLSMERSADLAPEAAREEEAQYLSDAGGRTAEAAREEDRC